MAKDGKIHRKKVVEVKKAYKENREKKLGIKEIKKKDKRTGEIVER
jgi:hypothetical protein